MEGTTQALGSTSVSFDSCLFTSHAVLVLCLLRQQHPTSPPPQSSPYTDTSTLNAEMKGTLFWALGEKELKGG